MKQFEPQILEYIEHIDELLYGTAPFESLKEWVMFSVDILSDYGENGHICKV